MNTNPLSFTAQYFDGVTSRAHVVEVSLNAGKLRIANEQIDKQIPAAKLEFSPAAGSATAIILCQDDGQLHITDLDNYALLVKLLRLNTVEQMAHFFETRWRFTLLALLFSGLLIAAGLRYGLPALATTVANRLPENIEQKMSEQSLKAIDQWLMSPSKLSLIRQQAITDHLEKICQQQRCPVYRLHFRESKIEPNAFALPSGDIVVTDALVTIAQHDEEILAVLFHELGHVKHRHSIRLAVQNTGAAALLIAITGDMSSITDLAAGLPMLLMHSGYQRDMEREADAFALTMLNASKIAPQHFAAILTRITELPKDPDGNKSEAMGLLSSHPDTESRILAFQAVH